jgi:hypothetical protein
VRPIERKKQLAMVSGDVAVPWKNFIAPRSCLLPAGGRRVRTRK